MSWRTRVQGEEESIRDFAYIYRSLCKRWNPDIFGARCGEDDTEKYQPQVS